MAYDIIKPRFPPVSPDGYWKYLASVGVPEIDLKNCCIKEGKVIAISTAESVDILCDGQYFYDVPVWMHTDAGARIAHYRKSTTGDSPDLEASLYFKNSAFMFPVPGCTPGEGWPTAPSFNDRGSGNVDFDVDIFTFQTTEGNSFSVNIIDSFLGSLAVINSTHVLVEYFGLPQQRVFIDGVELTDDEYILSGSSKISLFVETFSISGVTTIPVECVVSLQDGVVELCKSIISVHFVRPDYTDVGTVRIAGVINDSPKVHVMVVNSGGVKSAIGVIGIKSNNIHPAGFNAAGPFPTYGMHVKLTLKAVGPHGEIRLAKIYLYDVLNASLTPIPSVGESYPSLPFFEADIVNTGVGYDPIRDQDFYEEYAGVWSAESDKLDALDAFLDRGVKVSTNFAGTQELYYGDFSVMYWAQSGYYAIGDALWGRKYGSLTSENTQVENLSEYHWPVSGYFVNNSSTGITSYEYDFPLLITSDISKFGAAVNVMQRTVPFDFSSVGVITSRMLCENSGEILIESSGHELIYGDFTDFDTGPGATYPQSAEYTFTMSFTMSFTMVNGTSIYSYDKVFSNYKTDEYVYETPPNWDTREVNETTSEITLIDIKSGARNLICDESFIGVCLAHQTRTAHAEYALIGFTEETVSTSATNGACTTEFFVAEAMGDSSYISVPGIKDALKTLIENDMTHLSENDLNYAMSRFSVTAQIETYFVPFDIEAELLNG